MKNQAQCRAESSSYLSCLPPEIFTTHTAVTQNILRTEAQTHLPLASGWLVQTTLLASWINWGKWLFTAIWEQFRNASSDWSRLNLIFPVATGFFFICISFSSSLFPPLSAFLLYFLSFFILLLLTHQVNKCLLHVYRRQVQVLWDLKLVGVVRPSMIKNIRLQIQSQVQKSE